LDTKLTAEVLTMREAFVKHFDVVVVVWVLTLAVGWSLVALSRAELRQDQWGGVPQAQTGWVFTSDGN
jgi:hypothetical protein